ncbi:MAG: hypothetical protein V3W14_03745 [Candidatus Neomarinimicrobiota bacterium]
MTQQLRLSAFIEELRRRRVFRVTDFYGGIAFVIIQIIDGTFDLMGYINPAYSLGLIHIDITVTDTESQTDTARVSFNITN